MPKATIHIDMDKQCSECGELGACQNGLCLKCVTKNIVSKGERIKMSTNHAKPTITIAEIEDLKLTTKTIKVKDEPDRKVCQVSFIAEIPPADVARLLYLDYSGQQIEVELSSPQGMFDLTVEKIDIRSGELVTA